MTDMRAILVDLERCVECHACEVACKMENQLKGEPRIKVVTLGPEEVYGKLAADYVPFINDECDFCLHGMSQSLNPFCVSVCPTKALEFVDVSQALAALRSEKRYQICRAVKIE